MAKDPGAYSKDQMAKVMAQDIELCKERASLKNEINKLMGLGTSQEVKNYGS